MIVQAATFVERENESRIFPRWTVHYGIDQLSSLGDPSLNVVRRVGFFIRIRLF